MTAKIASFCAVLLVMTLETQIAKGQQATPTAPPDTGISCPIGFVRAVQMHSFKISIGVSNALFKDSTTRTLPAGWKAFRGQDLKKRIAKLASAPTADVNGGWASQAFFGESKFEKSYMDKTGDGLAVLILDTGSGLLGTACVVVDSSASTEVGTLPVEEGRSILVRVDLDGEPHALAMRVATIPTKNRSKEAKAFREGVMKVAVSPTHDLTPSKPRTSIADYLRSPASLARPTSAH